MGILSSELAPGRCLICGAASCACGPTDDGIGSRGTLVRNAPNRKGPVRRYETSAGSFFLSEADAIRRGLIGTPPPEPAAPPADARAVPAGRVGDVLDWAGSDPERLQDAITAEQDGKNRRTLVVELERRLDETR